MVDVPHERVDEKSPFRCTAVTHNGQCIYKRTPHSEFCPLHGGTRDEEKFQKYRLAKYRLTQYQGRVAEFANDDDIKSLREEIGILRMTLETLLNSLTDKNKLIIYIDKIQHLVGQIQKTVESAQRMEEKTNTLIDRKVVIVIADSMVNIISQYIKDPDELTMVAEKICASIESAASPTADVGAVA